MRRRPISFCSLIVIGISLVLMKIWCFDFSPLAFGADEPLPLAVSEDDKNPAKASVKADMVNCVALVDIGDGEVRYSKSSRVVESSKTNQVVCGEGRL